MGQLYRTQILLERQQHENLKELATAEGRSISEIIREAVAGYLVERDEQHEQQQWAEAMEELAKIRKDIESRFGVYPGDLVAEVRDERTDELWRVFRLLIEIQNRDHNSRPTDPTTTRLA